MKMLLCSIGSKKREITLNFGIEVAKALSAELTLLGVVDRERDAPDLTALLDHRAESLAHQGMSVEVRVEKGSAEDIVMAALKGGAYDLVTLGALAKVRSQRRFLDSVGMRVVERAQTSVLLVKGQPTSLSRVLICVSGAEHGRLSVWAGAALACGAGAKATVLHVTEPMPSMYTGLEQMEETLAELLQTDTDKARQLRWAAQVVKAECKVSEVKLRRGIVTDEIVRESEAGDYDVVVLGSSQTAGGLRRILMGNVARDIVARAQCPVLVVRPID